MKYLFFVFIYVSIVLLGCDNTPEIAVQSINVEIDDVLFIGQQANIKTVFFPVNTTERNLIYTSSDENILTISNSGVITPKNKGNVSITIEAQNGTEYSKNVAVYQIITKPSIINISEEWGPYEKIGGTGTWSIQEIGINNDVEIIINPYILVENARLVISSNGKLITKDNKKNNTKFSNVRVDSTGEYLLENITIVDLQINNRNGRIINCDFLPETRSNYGTGTLYVSVSNASTLELSKNIFRGKCYFSLFDSPIIRNNLFLSSIESSFSSTTFESFEYNTIDINRVSFRGGSYIQNIGYPTPNINFANNYWGTTDTTLIDNLIIDRNDSLSISYYVNYLPILNEKHELTPSLE